MTASRGPTRARIVGLGRVDELTDQTVNVQTVPLTPDGPLLEGILGFLDGEAEVSLRAQLLAAGELLVQTATEQGSQVVWQGKGLELAWYPSGQLSISGCIERRGGDGRIVAFTAELRPSWFYGVHQSEPSWEVEVSVESDCGADHVCDTPNTVHREVRSVVSPGQAVSALADAVHAIYEFANGPLDGWLTQATH